MQKVRVSLKPHVYGGMAGWKLQWYNGDRDQRIFTKDSGTAKMIKQRIKLGWVPVTGSMWAIKL